MTHTYPYPKDNIQHPDYAHLVGKSCNITIDGVTRHDQVLSFAGLNMVRQDVITTKVTRHIMYITDWDKVQIVESM